MKNKLFTTSIVLILLIIALALGLKFFTFIMGILAGLSYLEFYNYKYKNNNNNFIKISSVLILLFIIFNNTFYSINDILIYIISLIIMILVMFIFRKEKYEINDIIYNIGIIFILGLSYSVLISIYKLSIIRCAYVLIIAFITDIYSTIGTNLIGKHKINKTDRTIEGSIFGILMATLVGTVIHYNLIGENLFIVIIMSLLLSSFGLIGDLLFYNIKRKLNKNLLRVKVIEQFDSVLLVSLLYIIIINII